jgi:LemA protein
MWPAIILLVFLIVIALAVVSIYNGLIRVRNQVKNAWSQIDVQLKRRHDLIPNLVETVKGYAGHEKDTLERVIQARNQAVSAAGQGVPQQIEAEKGLAGAMGRLMVVVEQYPDLKANQNFLALQEELTSTENKIGFARQFYNDEVMKYNTKIQTIPNNIIAGMLNLREEIYFEVEEAAQREAPQVKF